MNQVPRFSAIDYHLTIKIWIKNQNLYQNLYQIFTYSNRLSKRIIKEKNEGIEV